MKTLFLAPALAVLLLTSCKDDSDSESPVISSIDLSKEKVAVGQLIILSSTVTDKDTDVNNLTYKWMTSDGFSSNEQEAEWVPASIGKKVITLTVEDGNSTTTQETDVEVVQPDFRLGLWGDTQQDIILSEENAGNEATIPEQGVLLYQGDEAKSIDAYFLDSDKLVEAATVYFPEYVAAEYNRFVTDYNAKKASLSTTYGTPLEDITEWATPEAEAAYANKPEKWGEAIAAGDLALASIWQASETTALALLLQENGEGGITYALVYFAIDEGGRYASPLNSDLLKGAKYLELIRQNWSIKR